MTEAATPETTSTPEIAPQEQASNDFSIPESYQDRGWAKDIKSQEDLWKLTDNAQSLIGKRPAGIPTADAPQEEWDKFYQALGRPEQPDAYELTDSFEGLPEEFELSEYKAKAQELAHKIGLSPKQAKDLWDNYMGMEMEAAKGIQEKNASREAELDKEFDELSSSLFGDSFKDVSAQAQKYLGEILPPELDGVVESLGDNPKALLALVKIANHSQIEVKRVKQKYGAEDSLASGSQASAISQQEIISKMAEAKKNFQNAPVFSEERKTLTAEIDNLRKQLQTVAR